MNQTKYLREQKNKKNTEPEAVTTAKERQAMEEKPMQISQKFRTRLENEFAGN